MHTQPCARAGGQSGVRFPPPLAPPPDPACPPTPPRRSARAARCAVLVLAETRSCGTAHPLPVSFYFREGLLTSGAFCSWNFLLKIFYLIKFLQPALLCVCQNAGARVALSSAIWAARSQRPRPGDRIPRSQAFLCGREIWDCQRVHLTTGPTGNLGATSRVTRARSPEPSRVEVSLGPGTALSELQTQSKENTLWMLIASS